MKSQISYPKPTQVKAIINLDSQDLTKAESVALTKLAKTVKAPGFRSGKAPLSVAKKHVSPDALVDETLNTAINRAVADTFIENNIQVIERPQVEVLKFVPGQELEVSAECAIVPAVKLGDYKNLNVDKPAVKVSAKEVDEVIERLQKGYASKEKVDRAAKKGDEVLIDFVGKKDDQPFDGGAATDHSLELGSGSFIPGFEEAIIGKKPGSEFNIEITFPKDYHVAELKGQPVVFETKLKEVKEVVLPAIDDQLAAKAGEFTALNELKDDIKKEISANKERQAENNYQDALVKKLIEVSEVSAPEVLVEDQLRSVEQDVIQNLRYQNVDLDSYVTAQGYETADEWRQKELKATAELRVKSGLVLAELSRVENIEASEDEIKQQVELYRQQAGKSATDDQFADPEIQRDIANRLVTEKTVQKLAELNSK